MKAQYFKPAVYDGYTYVEPYFRHRDEGFWYSEYEPHLPHPVAQDQPWEGQELFLAKLALVEGRLRPMHFMGLSNCRICQIKNGFSTYYTENDGWNWPSGFAHYIRDHNVKPTDDFIKFIMEY